MSESFEEGQRLKYRRQFLLSHGPRDGLDRWNSRSIGEMTLSTHPDLEVHEVSSHETTIVLAGYLFDAVDWRKGNSEILADILSASDSFGGFVEAIKRYAGRYVLLYRDQSTFRLVQDALSLREVYYATEENQVVCGSQPNLVAEYSSPRLAETTDPEVLQFFGEHMPGVANRTVWVGGETYYDGINHLLPNHYLDLNSRAVGRYWPNTPLQRRSLEETVELASRFLQGVMRAVNHREEVMMAITAGTDSRTLLAASREISEDIYYFINQERGLPDSHPDIAVPQRMFKELGLPFHIHQVPDTIDPGFRDIFLKNVFSSSDRILPTIYNVYYRELGERMNILGVGEIGRDRWGSEPERLDGYHLAYKLGYDNSPHAVGKCSEWLKEAWPVAKSHDINVLTLAYWEQKLGSWGTVGNSESDIAIEEFDPYGSHYLYEVLLGVDLREIGGDRKVVFSEMMRKMWPELLAWPINPPDTTRARLAAVLRQLKILPLMKAAVYRFKRWRYSALGGDF